MTIGDAILDLIEQAERYGYAEAVHYEDPVNTPTEDPARKNAAHAQLIALIESSLRRLAAVERVYEAAKGHTPFEAGVDVAASCKLCIAIAAVPPKEDA